MIANAIALSMEVSAPSTLVFSEPIGIGTSVTPSRILLALAPAAAPPVAVAVGGGVAAGSTGAAAGTTAGAGAVSAIATDDAARASAPNTIALNTVTFMSSSLVVFRGERGPPRRERLPPFRRPRNRGHP